MGFKPFQQVYPGQNRPYIQPKKDVDPAEWEHKQRLKEYRIAARREKRNRKSDEKKQRKLNATILRRMVSPHSNSPTFHFFLCNWCLLILNLVPFRPGTQPNTTRMLAGTDCAPSNRKDEGFKPRPSSWLSALQLSTIQPEKCLTSSR